jgi:hypothetical protein
MTGLFLIVAAAVLGSASLSIAVVVPEWTVF